MLPPPIIATRIKSPTLWLSCKTFCAAMVDDLATLARRGPCVTAWSCRPLRSLAKDENPFGGDFIQAQPAPPSEPQCSPFRGRVSGQVRIAFDVRAHLLRVRQCQRERLGELICPAVGIDKPHSI